MVKNIKAWIVDDDESIRWVLEKGFSEKGIEVTSFSSANDVLKKLEIETPNVILTDIRMPGTSGIALLDQIQKNRPEIRVIVMTAHSDLESAVNSYEHGAWEYLPKPFDINEALRMVERALKPDESYLENQENEVKAKIVGEAPAMQEVFRAIGKLSSSNSTVLLVGESGTGKELVARAIFEHSSRKDNPFIALNMADIPKELLEAELFGHERGAYTGATERREGRFELADGGTILLDEISEIAPSLQAKLLRVLQEWEFDRVGGNKTIQVKVRVLATTNRDLTEEVKKGNFREDLYYRLNVFPIAVPPLRERGDDILLLANTFLLRHARRHGIEKISFSKICEQAIQSHNWPGNVRELENAVERAVILADPGKKIEADLLGLGHLSLSKPKASKAKRSQKTKESSESESMGEVEKRHISKVLAACEGNRTHAAEKLGLNVRTLRNKIKQYSIEG